MAHRNIVMALSLVGALILPASTALAAGHGTGPKGHKASCTLSVARHDAEGKNRRQIEGTVVSVSSTPVVSGTTFVVKPQGSHGMTVTVGIDSSTVITAVKGVTTTTLAAGEQVHVAARAGAACTFTATRVVIQRAQGSDVDAQSHKVHKAKDSDVRRNVRHLEGTIVSLSNSPVVSGTTFVLTAEGSHGMTVTVGINSSTVITADTGVTMTTLAAGEQVHVTAQPDTTGMLVATNVEIQQSLAAAHAKGADTDRKAKH